MKNKVEAKQPTCQTFGKTTAVKGGKRLGIATIMLVIAATALCLSLFGCGGSSSGQNQAASSDTSQPSSSNTQSNSNSTAPTDNNVSQPEDTSDGTWRQFLTDYEAWIDNHYVPFMKKYKENPTDTSLAADAVQMSAEAQQWADRVEEWNANNLSADEWKEFSEIYLRISQKILSTV